MKKLYLLIPMIVLVLACRKDRRERIFEMTFPPLNFEVPAGLNQLQARVFAFNSIPTNIKTYLSQSNTDTSAIYAINPFFARITTTDNVSFNYLREVSVRACPLGQECTAFDEVFYLDDMWGRSYQTINLLPTLHNMKQLMSGEKFRLEIVFFLSEITPYSMSCRLEMGFEAVR